MHRALLTLAAGSVVLLLAGPAAAQKEWLREGYDAAARAYVAGQLEARGVEVSRYDVQIVRERSSYPRFFRRSGKAHLRWKVATGPQVEGTVEMKGEFGALSVIDTALGQKLYITSAGDQARQLMSAHDRRVETRARAVGDARTVFNRGVAEKLGELGLKLHPSRVRSTRGYAAGLERMDFTFKNRVPLAGGGKRLVQGRGDVALTWRDGAITGMAAKNIRVTKNRRTFWTAIRRRGR
jgi:hypothetical protein